MSKPVTHRRRTAKGAVVPLLLALMIASVAPTQTFAADVTVRDLAARLYHADRAHPIDVSHRDLRNLDMSGLDFKGAKLAGSDLFGADLSNDHPISVTYDVTQDPDFMAKASVEATGIRFYGTGVDQIECSSCHDVHDPDLSPFLRISNAGSALCLACHIK